VGVSGGAVAEITSVFLSTGTPGEGRQVANTAGHFMDYGPDWPPPPRPPSARRALLRRCMAVVVLYAVIWAVGSALLELRMLELRKLTGTPVTTYTTITGTPHHDRR
jgi:hypothetical protein